MIVSKYHEDPGMRISKLLEIRDSQNLAKLRHGFLVVDSFAFVVRAEFQVDVHAEFQL